jgi:CRISPR/Cas system-associated protein Csm6
MAMVMETLRATPDKFHRELETLLELLAAQERLVDSQVKKSMAILQPGETAEAQVVMAVQQRLKYRSGHRG